MCFGFTQVVVFVPVILNKYNQYAPLLIFKSIQYQDDY